MEDLPKYDFPRDDVMRVVPPSARRLLDVGCGGGGFGRNLRGKLPNLEIHGIEPDAVSARAAGRAGYDEVAVGYFPDALSGLPSTKYDVVCFNDVLEHMPKPDAALQTARTLLEVGGTLIVSVPNVRNWSVWLPLLRRGRWDYTEQGILDSTHVRFFTRGTIRELLEASGWQVHEIVGVNHNGQGRKNLVRVLGGARLQDFFWQQFVVTASIAN